MTLTELAEQYRDAAATLTDRIHELTARLKTKNGDEYILEKRRISSLYADAAACRDCADMLENYYKGGNHGQDEIQP